MDPIGFTAFHTREDLNEYLFSVPVYYEFVNGKHGLLVLHSVCNSVF